MFDDDSINAAVNDIHPTVWGLIPWLIVAAVLLGVWIS
jgi:hypothetical protein